MTTTTEQPLVRVWQDRADGQGRYATVGRLITDDGTTATVAVARAGRNTTGDAMTVTLTARSADVERMPTRCWSGYGSAPCMADYEDEPADTLEADLAASLHAVGLEQ